MENKDCLFIGHNEMDFSVYEENIRKMGMHSGAYRDLNLNFLQYDNKLYTASDMFNLFYCSGESQANSPAPLTMGETFSAAIAYLGSYAVRKGFTFDYVNSFREDKEELAEKLSNGNYLGIAIVTTLYVSALPIIEIVNFIRQYNKNATIIVGGPFVSTQFRTQEPEPLAHLLQITIGADIYINSAQGEETLTNVLEALRNQQPLDSIHNLYFKKGDDYILTPLSREDNKISANMVDWDLFADKLGKYANLRTAISCPFQCAFCGFPEHAGKYQMAGVAEIEQELMRLDRLKKVDYAHFIDDTFNVPTERFKDILRMMIKNQFQFQWYSHFRCQFADRETVELMKKSGCKGVFLGIESGSDRILKNMNKNAAVEKYLNGISLLKEYGIITYGSFIIGFPGETEETVRETVQFIRQSGLDFFRAQLWYCEPITPIFKKKDEYKIKGESFEWSHSTMNSKKASELIEDIFLSIQSPIWVPQYNFECDGVFHLFPEKISLEKVKDFLNAFNAGVREKIRRPSKKEIGFEVLRQLKTALNGGSAYEEIASNDKDLIEKFDAHFDF